MARKKNTEWIRVADLQFDHSYQRATENKFVTQIVNNFDPDALGNPEVSIREDGSKWVVDGQHRVEALMRMDWGDQLIECKVHRDLTVAQEARLFVELNTKRTVRPSARFKARVKAHDPDAVEILRIANNHGLDRTELSAIGTIERIYAGRNGERHPERLDRTLSIIAGAWGTGKVPGPIYSAVAAVTDRYPEINLTRLRDQLASSPGGPDNILGSARGMKGIRFGTLTDCTAAVILDRYDNGLRSKALGPWTRVPVGKK